MRELTYADALREALREEMLRDPRVVLMGEEIGVFEGVYKVTRGLLKEFGPGRVRDTPISEAAIAGAAIGAAGLRADLSRSDSDPSGKDVLHERWQTESSHRSPNTVQSRSRARVSALAVLPIVVPTSTRAQGGPAFDSLRCEGSPEVLYSR